MTVAEAEAPATESWVGSPPPRAETPRRSSAKTAKRAGDATNTVLPVYVPAAQLVVHGFIRVSQPLPAVVHATLLHSHTEIHKLTSVVLHISRASYVHRSGSKPDSQVVTFWEGIRTDALTVRIPVSEFRAVRNPARAYAATVDPSRCRGAGVRASARALRLPSGSAAADQDPDTSGSSDETEPSARVHS